MQTDRGRLVYVASILLLLVALAACPPAIAAAGQEERPAFGSSRRAADESEPLEATEPPELEYPATDVLSEKPPRTQGNIDLDKVGEEMGANAASEDGDQTPVPSGGLGVAIYLKAAAALLLVLGLIVLLSYGVRRLGGRSPLLRGLNLGQVLGRIYLTPRASLHFIRAGGRVLVVGVSPNQVSLVAEFDASAFEAELEQEGEEAERPQQTSSLGSFISHLVARPTPGAAESAQAVSDAEIASLRGDIQRLQEYLRETSRGEPSR